MGTSFDDYVKILNQGICKIVFIKTDSSKRILYGTRNVELLSKMFPTVATKFPKVGEELYDKDKENRQIRIFDIQKKAYRSFSELFVVSFEFITDSPDWVAPENDTL